MTWYTVALKGSNQHDIARVDFAGVDNADDMARVDIAGVDNAGVVKSAIWVIIIGYFNNRFMDFNGLFVAALTGNLNT